MREGARFSPRAGKDSTKIINRNDAANIPACRERWNATKGVAARDSSKLRSRELRRLSIATSNHLPDWFLSGLGLLFGFAAERPLAAVTLAASGKPDSTRSTEDSKRSQFGLRGMARKPHSKRFDSLATKHEDVMLVGDLLIRALAIETDIRRRALRRPASKTLLRQRKEYEKLVGQLLWEHQTLLSDYLALIRLVTKY